MDPSSELQLLHTQQWSEGGEQQEGKEMGSGEVEEKQPPLSTFYLSRGCNAGKLDQPPPERPDQGHFLCN